VKEFVASITTTTTATITALRPLYRSTCVSRHLQIRTVGAQFYCPHVLADGNQCIRIREKTLEFSTVLYYTTFVAGSGINIILL